MTALLAMLASCASGLVVVGIDNGFGAACAVARILGPAPTSRGPHGVDVGRRTGRPMTTVAWWHCFAGIAGDMALGSLVDAGADLTLVERELVALPVGGWSLEATPVLRAGLACTQVRVRARDTQVVRTHAHIVGLITEARLPERARQRALATFARLAEVEGRLHRRPAVAGALPRGGRHRRHHRHRRHLRGPRAARRRRGAVQPGGPGLGDGPHVPRHPSGPRSGGGGAAARGAHLRDRHPGRADDPDRRRPAGDARAPAGGRCRPWRYRPAASAPAAASSTGMPNAVQVVIGTALDQSGVDPEHGQPVVVLEANVDDVTGEILGATVAALMRAGALDAWVTPVTGKKGRPAHVVSVLGDPAAVGRLRQVLADETGTLGIRAQSWQRWPAERQFAEVEVGGYPVRVKRGPRRIKAEHDDAARVAGPAAPAGPRGGPPGRGGRPPAVRRGTTAPAEPVAMPSGPEGDRQLSRVALMSVIRYRPVRPVRHHGGVLEARQLSVEVGGRLTLEEASFLVRAGDKVGLVGRNGAGKTSLLKVLGGEVPPTAGTVTVQGRLGFLSQDPRAARHAARRHRPGPRPVGPGPRRGRRPAGEAAHRHGGAPLGAGHRPLRPGRGRLRGPGRLRGRVRGPPDRRRTRAWAPTASTCPSGCSPGASGAGSSWPASSSPAATCSSSTSRPTTSTATPRHWLMGFLRAYRGALLVVSHDLDLLDEAITRVLHLDEAQLVEYKGTYSQYREARAADEVRLAKLADPPAGRDQAAVDPGRLHAPPDGQAGPHRQEPRQAGHPAARRPR